MTKQAPTFTAPDESCYVQINGFTIYIEVSEATDGVPYVSGWDTEGKLNDLFMERDHIGIIVDYVDAR